MRYLMVWIIVVFLMMTAAAPTHSHEGDRLRGEVTIEIVSESGSAFLIIPHKDFWSGGTHIIKKYLEAKRGEHYGIVIHNRTPERIGLVIAVDGRNIISGKKSDLKTREDMYIVNRYEHGQFTGWRTASDKVHRFYFTDMGDSYAMKTFSDSTSMGVIAVAIYREKERPLYEKKTLNNTPASPLAESPDRSKSGAARDERAGTGFGNEQYSPTIKVAFEPEATPIQKTLVKYEWRETLCRKGFLNCTQEPANRLWDEDDYAPFPPGYPRN